MLSIRCLPLMNPMRTRDTYDAIIDFIEELITTDHEMHSDRVQIETKLHKMFTSKLKEVKSFGFYIQTWIQTRIGRKCLLYTRSDCLNQLLLGLQEVW